MADLRSKDEWFQLRGVSQYRRPVESNYLERCLVYSILRLSDYKLHPLLFLLFN